MPLRIAYLAILLSLLTNAALATDQRKIAVLEFEVTKGLDIDRIYFSDKVRGLVGEEVPSFFVMTRESTEALLQAQGKTMADCVGECEVEIGRKLGADYVISGRLTKLSKRLALTLRLHSTTEGRLIASKEAVAANTDSLADASNAAVRSLLVPLRSPTRVRVARTFGDATIEVAAVWSAEDADQPPQTPSDVELEAILRVIRGHMDEWAWQCAAEAMRVDESYGASDSVNVLMLEIQSDGGSIVRSVKGENAVVNGCIARVAAKWQFQKPRGGRRLRVTFPIEAKTSPN